jgi:hypothetical protein
MGGRTPILGRAAARPTDLLAVAQGIAAVFEQDAYAEDQMLLAFVVETEGSEAADALARAASVPEGGDALGVAAGRLCCVLIGRSFVMESEAFESPGALERFRSAIRRQLERVE